MPRYKLDRGSKVTFKTGSRKGYEAIVQSVPLNADNKRSKTRRIVRIFDGSRVVGDADVSISELKRRSK